MSQGKTHHHLGDSGTASSHHRAEAGGHHESHNSQTFRALHHEATGSLAGPAGHRNASPFANGEHAENAHLSIPAGKGAESHNISAHHTAARSESHASRAEAKGSPEAGVKHLDFAGIPTLTISHDRQRRNDDLATLIPNHLLTLAGDKRPVVTRVSQEDDGNSGKEVKVSPVVAQFDSSKKIAEMSNNGAIVDRTSAVTDQSEKARLAPGETPTIKVSYNNDSTTGKPDFLIKKDGTVEMFSNPQQTNQKEIVVQFEKDGQNFDLTDAQKAAGAKFYDYLQSQLKAQFPQAAADAFKVEDQQNLLRSTDIPKEVKQNLDSKAGVNPSSGLPENAGPTIRDTNRISRGGATSDVRRSDVNEMTPPAQRIPNEADRMAAMKDTVASYVTRGEAKPYEHVSKRGERGWGVGRYGMDYKQVSNWLSGLTDEQIQELIKQGKLSPQAAEKLQKMRDSILKAKASGKDTDLHPFLKQMKDGTGTAEEMKAGVKEFLPDKVQELAASDQIAKISGELSADQIKRGEKPSVDPGQVALSFVLGRNVGKEEFEGNPDYKQFVESARQAYRLQEQARLQSGDIINVENMSQVGQALNKMVGMQFWREAAGATEYGNKGCAIAVTRALQSMGVKIGTHLDVTGTAQDMRQRGWKEVSVAEAIRSGQLYVPVNKETGSHIGLGIGRQIWENSSSQRQFVTRDVSASTLRHSGRAFIVPIAETNKT